MINLELVAAIAARSGAGRSEVVADFRDSMQQDLANLRAAAVPPQPAQLALHAHRLRGASEMMGAADVAEACRLLEQSAAGGDAARMAAALAAVEHRVQALDARLQAWGAGADAAPP